ncbi:MAG: hypothetical protein R3362_00885 [Rhodothermales bacterium]|nr:hypothetical protein [Rhodothermales bacterium]
MRALAPLVALALPLLVLGCTGSAPPPAATPFAEADTLALRPLGPPFREARAVAADPTGRLYVVDAAAAGVAELGVDGLPLGTLGGPGSGDYAFLSPADVDPTNGLVVYVADAGNGRVQRFSRQRRLLETIPVPADPERVEAAQRTGRSGFEATPDTRALTGAGRPVAVASAATGEVYAVEDLRGVVLRWEDRQRLTRVIGGPEMGAGALEEPVDLALGPDGTLFVADRAQAAVLVYDPFGSFVRRIADGAARGLRAVTVHRDRLLLVLDGGLLVYSLEGRFVQALHVPLDGVGGTPRPADLVGVAGLEDRLYLLTPTQLFVADAPGGAGR